MSRESKIPIPQSFGLGTVDDEKDSVSGETISSRNKNKRGSGDVLSNKEKRNDEETCLSLDDCLRLDGALQCWFLTHRKKSVNGGMSITTCQRILSRHFVSFLERTIPRLYSIKQTNAVSLLVCQPSPSTAVRLVTLEECHRTSQLTPYDVSRWIESHRQNQLSKRIVHPELSSTVSQTMPWLCPTSKLSSLSDNSTTSTVGTTLQERISAREQERLQRQSPYQKDKKNEAAKCENDFLPLWRVADALQSHVQRKCRRMYHPNKSSNKDPRMPLPNQLLESNSSQIQKIQELIPTWIQTNKNNIFTIPILTNAIYSQTIRIHLIPKSANKQTLSFNNNKEKSYLTKGKDSTSTGTPTSLQPQPFVNNPEESKNETISNDHGIKKRKRGSKLSLTNRLVKTKFPYHNQVQIKKKCTLVQAPSQALDSTKTDKTGIRSTTKKTRVLRVNHNLHLTEADVDGGIELNNMNNSMATSTSRGLKRLFHQMNTGQRI